MSEKSCPICGKPTNVYMGHARKDGLCREHGKLANTGELIKCPICYNWKMYNEECATCKSEELEAAKKKQKSTFENVTTPWVKPKKVEVQDDKKPTMEEIEQEEKKCLLCNSESGNYLFCKSCFSKHHGKTLLFKITCDKNQKLELLNESYEGIYVCKDGHIVKSKSERDIDNYLFEHKIAHAYEKALPINGEVFKPDFYLKDLDVYIEHWGYDESNKEYTNRKEYKIPKYEEKGITLICTYEATDMQDVETSLQIKLESYQKGKINFL